MSFILLSMFLLIFILTGFLIGGISHMLRKELRKFSALLDNVVDWSIGF
jgi:cbb3-type cytochrome oxidase subunit 3